MQRGGRAGDHRSSAEQVSVAGPTRLYPGTQVKVTMFVYLRPVIVTLSRLVTSKIPSLTEQWMSSTAKSKDQLIQYLVIFFFLVT